jgi:tetratricopeptide (TPR) repeat protein
MAVLFEPGCNVGVPLDLYGELGVLGDDEQTLPNMSVAAVALARSQREQDGLDGDSFDELETTGVVTLKELLGEKSDATPSAQLQETADEMNESEVKDGEKAEEESLPELPAIETSIPDSAGDASVDLLEPKSSTERTDSDLPPSKGPLIGGLVIALGLGAIAGGLMHYRTELALTVVERNITREEKGTLAGEYSTSEKAWFAYEAGYAAFEKEKFEEAVTHFQAAIQLNFELAPAHRGLASSLTQLKKFYRARKAYRVYGEKEEDAALAKEVKLLLKSSKSR